MEDGPEKTRLIELLANHMKKSILSWNREAVEDIKIFDDLRTLSNGRIDVNEETIRLMDAREIVVAPRNPQPTKSNNNKNRKNQR